MRTITRRTALALAASALAAPTAALAQAGFPSKPIRLVVPFP
ncbi:MAG: tripartite tricarboxylate transporter substrate binding protein, partial [Ramlibacter sp.]|nr:tripartite tricarboxylate transporter substrate binding protein [Ramlibacter sp.]